MKCRMLPTGVVDHRGKLCVCANTPCDARGFIPHGKPDNWRVNGYGDECRGGQETHSVQRRQVSPLPQLVSPPPRLELAARFAKALIRHVATGAHMRTKEEIEAILEQHCKPCEHFTGGSCSKCGCAVNGDKKLLNKLAMRSEACPLEKWK